MVAGPLASALAGEEAALVERREAYARVTVVWSASPVSARAGDTALVTPDGRLRGWIGGSCAEPVVVRQALDALAEGLPRLVHLAPPDQLPAPRPGRFSAPVTCASEGSLEIFVEPRLPAPHLVVIGRSPLTSALATMAGAVGFDVVVVEAQGHDGIEVVPPARLVSELDLAAAGVDVDSYVVVATMGRYDEDALVAALASGAGYVALVASERRAVGVVDLLRSGGAAEDDLARVKAPAGLALGELPHVEIAVPILAEIVATKAAAPPVLAPGDRLNSGSAGARTKEGRGEVLDPVCGMTVELDGADHVSVHDGVTYAFCAAGCRRRFETEPTRFVTATSSA